MSTFVRLLVSETIKLRRSAAFRMVWMLPILFLLLDFFLFGRDFLGAREPLAKGAQTLELLPLKAVGAIWAGYCHPLLLALLPALVIRPEHRFGLWKHLHAMPVMPRSLFLAKAATVLVLVVVSLGLVASGLWIEWSLLAEINPLLSFRFPWGEMLNLMGWLLLGSLPLLALYLWLSVRINSGVVPILFGLIGLMLVISLSGQEVYPSWRRDLIPWVLPYTCAQQSIERIEARQETHLAGVRFKRDIDLKRLTGTEVIYLPSGRKVTSVTTIPDFLLYPPPPTPKWILALFSLGLGLILLALGLVDAKRNRV